MFHKNMFPSVTNVTPVNNRILYALVEARPPLCFIVAYAPQALHMKEVKDSFWDKLKEVYNHIPAKYIKIVLGDFNAKIIEDVEGLEHLFGKYFFKADGMAVSDLSEQVQDNRERFIEFCSENELCVTNTMYDKPKNKLITHLHVGTNREQSDLTPSNSDQCDFVLIDKRWKNANKNTEADMDTLQGSDHFPVWAKFRIGLKVPKKKSDEKHAMPRKATKEEIEEFNKHIKDENNTEVSFEDKLKTAAQQCVTKPKQKAKKPWITEQTLKLIDKKHELEFVGKDDQYKLAAKQAQKSVKKRLERLANGNNKG
jgi:hypothetical protein